MAIEIVKVPEAALRRGEKCAELDALDVLLNGGFTQFHTYMFAEQTVMGVQAATLVFVMHKRDDALERGARILAMQRALRDGE